MCRQYCRRKVAFLPLLLLTLTLVWGQGISARGPALVQGLAGLRLPCHPAGPGLSPCPLRVCLCPPLVCLYLCLYSCLRLALVCQFLRLVCPSLCLGQRLWQK